MKRAVLLFFVLLVGCAGAPPASPPVVAARARAPAPSAAAPEDPAAGLLNTIARFEPEAIGSLGLGTHEDDVADLSLDVLVRQRKAIQASDSALADAFAKETDASRRQDIVITRRAAARLLRSIDLDEKRFVPYRDLGKTIFLGLSQHLRPGGHANHALARVHLYAVDFGPRARAQIEARLAAPDASTLVWPARAEIEQHLANVQTYLEEIERLFTKSGLVGWQEPWSRVKRDVGSYDDFVRVVVLPKARSDFKLPLDIYDFKLAETGVDMPRAELESRARAAFAKTKTEMQALTAPRDYRAVIREQRAQRVPDAALVALYRERVSQIEAIIKERSLVTLPARAVRVRLATAAETAQNPSPTIDAQALFKKDEELSFLIPVAGPPRPGETSAAYDDFAYPAVAWTIAAHEARPGHELQFSIMKERGLSLARTVFAFNSANVEGWGLYSEKLVYPYMPADGKLASLRMRALREARAFLDPGLHEGTVSLDEARRVLAEELVFGDGVVRQELDRYTFGSPAQATAYFYGFEKLAALRVEVEHARGPSFDARAFNDTVLAQGLLPPDLLREAVLSSIANVEKR